MGARPIPLITPRRNCLLLLLQLPRQTNNKRDTVMPNSSSIRHFAVSALAAATLLAGCSMTKPPEHIKTDVPAQYREALPGIEGAWKLARPADATDRGTWWTVFDDTDLNGLIMAATQSNSTLAIALARVKEARAIAGIVDANRAFQLSAGFGPTKAGDSTGTTTQWRAQLNASYEVDLFGRLSDTSRAARLDAQAQEAAYRSVLLALQADVAQQYFSIRSLDTELDVLQKTIKLRQDALRLVQHRYDVGDTSELDVAQAKTELSTAQAEEERVK
ncbi:MAG TPA: TolC family protein, partial [Rhodanobacteraceae bacterium]|nr:TolC family protein [Rhodanobacteraceae bacterium]